MHVEFGKSLHSDTNNRLCKSRSAMAISVLRMTRNKPNHEKSACFQLKKIAPRTIVSMEATTGSVHFGRCSGGMVTCSTAIVNIGAKFLKTVTNVRVKY